MGCAVHSRIHPKEKSINLSLFSKAATIRLLVCILQLESEGEHEKNSSFISSIKFTIISSVNGTGCIANTGQRPYGIWYWINSRRHSCLYGAPNGVHRPILSVWYFWQMNMIYYWQFVIRRRFSLCLSASPAWHCDRSASLMLHVLQITFVGVSSLLFVKLR